MLKERNGAGALVRFEKSLMLSKALADKVRGSEGRGMMWEWGTIWGGVGYRMVAGKLSVGRGRVGSKYTVG